MRKPDAWPMPADPSGRFQCALPTMICTCHHIGSCRIVSHCIASRRIVSHSMKPVAWRHHARLSPQAVPANSSLRDACQGPGRSIVLYLVGLSPIGAGNGVVAGVQQRHELQEHLDWHPVSQAGKIPEQIKPPAATMHLTVQHLKGQKHEKTVGRADRC